MSDDRAALRDSVIVSTDWLAARLDDAGIRVVDVRGKVLPPGALPRYFAKREDYAKAHVPGAVFVDWTRDIVDPDDPIPAQIAKPEPFAAAMSALGIADDTMVVAYDDYDHIFASRLVWALRYYGHDRVRILDGGFSRWLAEGRPTSADVPRVAPTRFSAASRPALRKTADELADALGRGDVLIVDARPPEQYAGEASAAARKGHIPGAKNVHYASLIDPRTSRFLPNGELARVFAEAGIDVDKLPGELVVYCNAGVSCTVPLQALQMFGRSDVAVYDGSWNEWGNDEHRPVVLGRKP